MAELGFELTGTFTEQKNSYELVAPGEYTVIMVDSELKESQKDDPYINATYEIIGGNDGKHNGQKLFDIFMLKHSNKDVVKRAMETLQNIGNFVGVDKFKDTEPLHGKPFVVKVGIEKGKDGYEDKARVRAYMSCDTSAATPISNAVPTAVAPTPSAAPKPPWAA